jgi:transposase
MADQDKTRWTRLVSDFETSDLSQREFAQARGVLLSNLRYWIYRLRKESRPLVTVAPKRSGQEAERPEQPAAPEGSRLLPVRVVASAPKARSEVVNTGLLELVLPSGAKLRFPAGTDLGYHIELAAAL